MTRTVRIAVTIAVLAALQIAAYLVYRAVDRSRTPRAKAAPFESERLRGTEAAPPLDAVRADDRAADLTWPTGRIRVVHFWATWCKPCRTELPDLLALSRDLQARGVELVAVAVDDSWADIRTFFQGDIPPEVVIALDPDIHKRYGVSTLPDSYIVDRAGNLLERIHGARDWGTAEARMYLLGLLD